ncbi:glycosyltransferase [Clostridium disporicum]|uniref:Glycosyltransferase n=1 Tax=Clostridium disporicum TaxID=84024 RepID=A0A174EZN3_9CLOT|nr:glycosyltransferase family 2 protein [Clostridium disporicum]CUO42747.1 glycosyltransferase [Clostridium disporicum]
MEKVAIVILNYLNYKDTIECVESLNNDKYCDKEVVIVDNGSNNDSWTVLEAKYCNSRVHLLKSDKNLGFAKGNNIGINYAVNKLNCKFVLLVNNDTIFNDSNLITELMNAYEEGVAVIGPRIIAANGVEQNPVPAEVSKARIEEEFAIYKSLKYRFYNGDLYIKLNENEYFKKMKIMIKKYLLRRGNIDKKGEISNNKKSQDLVLHGACMLLTKDYFNYYSGLFPNTFLYYEENILTLLTKKVGLYKKFINSVNIYHKEDQSSKMSFNNLSKVKKKYLFDSMKLCKELFDLSYDQIINKFF